MNMNMMNVNNNIMMNTNYSMKTNNKNNNFNSNMRFNTKSIYLFYFFFQLKFDIFKINFILLKITKV